MLLSIYHPIDYRKSDLVKLDIKLNGDNVDALTVSWSIVQKQNLLAEECTKLKEIRQSTNLLL